MSKLRVCKWTFVFCLGALFVYVAVLAYRSAYGGPWWTAELNAAALVLGALAADISFRCWQVEDAKARAWQREDTQRLYVLPPVQRFSTVYTRVPVAPPLHQPARRRRRSRSGLRVSDAEIRGMLSRTSEDTGDINRETG